MQLKFIKIKKEKGYVAFFVTILVLSALMGIAISIVILTLSIQKISANIIKSSQAYYAAEAGIEDSLLRIFDPSKGGYVSPNTLSVGGATANITIEKVSTSLTIESQGNASGRIRKLKVKALITSDEANFYYGVQVGDGGLVLGNSGARIKGNVFSNGNIVVAGGGKCVETCIDNSVIVANNGNWIDGLIVGENATVHTCFNSDIAGELTYVSGGSYGSCTYGFPVKEKPDEIDPIPLPISSIKIQEWKDDASENVFTGNYILDVGDSAELGPMQIQGNLTVENNAHLTLKGTIYVTGNIIFKQGAIIDLDVGSYNYFSGVVIADNIITVENGVSLNGTGEEGSYILVISESNSLDPAIPAIFVGNTAQGAIFYTNYGLIRLNNNMFAREVTGYKVWINNNAVIEYESGLENPNFISGPGGGWKIDSWEEIE